MTTNPSLVRLVVIPGRNRIGLLLQSDPEFSEIRSGV
jgi:hypothetical protein